MSNNKLKNMIDDHELDDFVTNTDLSNKLRNTKTSEEVLELLKKYNYNESKEVFEVELMDLLKEFVDEEELLKVSGGKNNKKSFSNIVTSLAITGSLCMPVQGVTGVQQKEKREDKKSSYSVGLPKGEKIGIGVAGIIGVGVILEEVLRRKVFAKKDKHCRVLTDQKYEEMHEHFMKIATSPEKCKPDDFKKYTLQELGDYMFEELLKWFQYMEQYHRIDEENCYVTKTNCETDDGYDKNFVAAWNGSLPKLVCIHLADISVRANLHEVDDKTLQNYLTCISKAADILKLPTKTNKPKHWKIDSSQLTNSGVSGSDATILQAWIRTDSSTTSDVMNRAVLAYVTDWGAIGAKSQLKNVTDEKLLSADQKLGHVTDYVKSEEYKTFRDDLNITT